MEDDWDTLEDARVLVRKRGSHHTGAPPPPLLGIRKRRRTTPKKLQPAERPRRCKPKGPSGGGAPRPAVLWHPTGPLPHGPEVHIASDCTGLNTANIALQMLGFRVVDEFVSETDDKTRQVLQFNFAPKRVYADMMTRNDDALPVTLTLYTAGPPCQSFSVEGLGHGLADHRGVVFLRVLRVVA
ncbi:MAG: DNA cytosine methyltransferase, partial [bacterium]|nr:DNA cytosine methyltransferase [bacterium]